MVATAFVLQTVLTRISLYESLEAFSECSLMCPSTVTFQLYFSIVSAYTSTSSFNILIGGCYLSTCSSRHGVIFETVASLLSLLRTGEREAYRQFFLDAMLLVEGMYTYSHFFVIVKLVHCSLFVYFFLLPRCYRNNSLAE